MTKDDYENYLRFIYLQKNGRKLSERSIRHYIDESLRLIDKNMTKTDLRIKADMSTATLAKMSKNEIVSMDILLRICRVLECNVGDIIDVINSDRV